MKRAASTPLTPEMLRKMDAHWRAANYLSVGQIYLYDNPLLTRPLTREHVKPRLLGHWGTTPGLNFIYTHLNRVIRQHDLSVLYITGPGHGGPGLVANAYLDGTYSEVYPNVSQDEQGLHVTLADGAVHVDVEEVEPGGGAPVAEQPRLDVLGPQRLAQQRVVEQIDLADGEVVRSAPGRVDPAERLGAQRRGQRHRR